ncbi:uncharacterized protein EV420DRAFT_1764575 [Desarmillaria tabescens]|uniref:F-box domain-containing protein n=1 Tax=Armillaria tabescens TaxID=1929756 RepID=A0AA39N5F0_ARMTA|nr:uncharacterized protein EV420DRAFT_1764575 [Desarmillaria tabescens]KAK0458103.1 hypothetical protein EV420DRAFT_1764575 [Desarmillaria tabescens]
MNLETNSHATPASAADALSHLDAFTRSIPKPVFPPDAIDPLVSGILRATRPLLDTDPDWILPNIALLEGQLHVYDTLIDQLYTVFEELETYRDAIQVVSTQFSSTLAPIRRLPSKVLRSIFRETQSSDLVERWSMNSRPIIGFMQDPLTLSQVCGSWRDIVVSSPELWSHIKITYPRLEPDNPSASNFQSLLKTILPLSDQLPLDMQFKSDEHTSSGDAIEVFSLLLGERHRWRSASLKLPLDLLELLKSSSRKLACLESLTLVTPHIPRDDGAFSPGDVSDVFIEAPSLRKVELHELIGLDSFALPRQITHLAASITAIHNLHTHSLLEELHLKQRDIDDIAFPHRITLPKVRRLSVLSLKLLRYLCLPSLEDLTFDSHVGSLFPTIDEARIVAAAATLNDFIRSSRCSLTSLATGTAIAHALDFIQETLPMLESLTSLEFPIDREGVFYNALTSSSNLLPNLQHLTMCLPLLEIWGGMSGILVPWDSLSAMMTSRRHRLRSVRFDYPTLFARAGDEFPGIPNTELEQLRKLGIDLRTVDPHSFAGVSFGNFA